MLHTLTASATMRRGFAICKKATREPASRRMYPFVSKSLRFKFTVHQLTDAANLRALQPVERLSKHQEILRSAGRQARDSLVRDLNASAEATCLAHGSIARAVVNNDADLSRAIIRRMIGGADYLAT